MASEVYVNGKFNGEIDDKDSFISSLKQERSKNQFLHNINIFFDDKLNHIYVETLQGRTRRPLIVVKDGIPLLTDKHIKQLQKKELKWSDLVKERVIEYLDAAEEENALVAFSEKEITYEHTHLEISPIAMLGLVTSLVPYGNFVPSSRLSIGAKNQKYSLGIYAANFLVRMDMDVHLLHTPQLPIVKTITNDLSNFEQYPCGQNIVIAIMSYQGYNMEDAIIVNKGSIDRGFARSTYYRPAIAEELRYAGGLTDQITIPDKEVKGYKSEKDYRFLEDDGIIYTEANIKEEDVVIGKTSPPRFLSSLDEYSLASNIRRESSIALKHGEDGVVDFVLITENEEGNKLVQVRMRKQMIPEIGDKFTSRYSQKGIIGMIIPEADMPFTSKGIIPDIIFSPHSIPSRMTVAHVLEAIGGKTGALSGRYINGTSFNSEAESDLRKELLSLGFKENGTETMYNGISGEKFEVDIFVGNMYYLKLKHLVANKIQSRARGPVALLTRQPTEGRAKEGGLRLGEMEKDTMIAHGSSLLLKERFDSDKTIVSICEGCGMFAIRDAVKDKCYCPICGDNTAINNIEISYAFKLMLDEFKSLGIYPKLILKNKY